MLIKTSISILGCGWLGLPLAKSLISEGVNVKGSTTSVNKLSALAEAGIAPYLVQFGAEDQSPLFDEFLKSDVLIITVPPGKTPEKQQNYSGMLACLTEAIPKSSIRKIIFISSTSVYGELNKSFTEADDPHPTTDAGVRMMQAEQKIAAIPSVQTIILRLAGLIGPGRHPGRFLAGKKDLPNGLAPVNLVHQADVIDVINQILQTPDSSGIYNVCTPHHPEKQLFYRLATEKLGLEPPGFISEKTEWKIVSSNRVKEELHYSFEIPDLIQWLDQA